MPCLPLRPNLYLVSYKPRRKPYSFADRNISIYYELRINLLRTQRYMIHGIKVKNPISSPPHGRFCIASHCIRLLRKKHTRNRHDKQKYWKYYFKAIHLKSLVYFSCVFLMIVPIKYYPVKNNIS